MSTPALRPPCEGAAAEAAPETPGCAAHARRWVLAGTVLASSTVFLESTVINVALPAIQGALGAAIAELQWIANAYTLVVAALTLVGGALGDRFGRRRMLAIGLVVFIAGTCAAALAGSGIALIAARAVQGLGAALVEPNSLAHLSASFPRNARGRAIGVWSAASAVTGGGSPLIGGWLVDAGSWRAVFLLAIPFALVALVLAVARMPESRASAAARIDVAGAALATLALAAITYGLIAAAAGAARPVSWGAVLLGMALLAAFVWHEARTRSPMVPLGLFRVRTFSAANLLTLLLYFAISGTFFLLPLNLAQAHGYSATWIGTVYLPFALAMGVLSHWAGGLVDRWGAKRPLVIGPLITAAGLALLGRPGPDSAYWSAFFAPMLLVGIGMAVTVAPLTAVVMGTVEPGRAGVASGINNTVARLASLLAVAVVGLIALTAFRSALPRHFEAFDVPAPLSAAVLAERSSLGDVRLPVEADGETRTRATHAVRAAVADAFAVVAWISAGLAVGSAICAGLWLENNRVPTSV